MVTRTIAITGASGLIGSALASRLTSAGDRVVRFTRTGTSSDSTIAWDPAVGRIDADRLKGVDAVVHLAGAGIGDKRWTDDYKRQILDSRTKSTALLASAMASLADGPRVLLSGSAIGYYGESLDTEFDESSAAGTGFLADVCVRWEQSAAPAVAAGIRTAYLRTGIVLSPAGGALKKLLPLFKLGAGGRMGSGRQWQSWISIDDEVSAIDHLLRTDVSGAVNLTAPTPTTQAEFTRVLAKVLKRPALLPVPSFGPRLLLGGELADALLFTGQKVMPGVLASSGYSFIHGDLETALRHLLKR
ncbi:MAG: TIGR01777 family oxidoreductase [Actinobacteria bacterium]|nr:TIGR01777 family oxidoreductase [Actinomycetota bacterium]